VLSLGQAGNPNNMPIPRRLPKRLCRRARMRCAPWRRAMAGSIGIGIAAGSRPGRPQARLRRELPAGA